MHIGKTCTEEQGNNNLKSQKSGRRRDPQSLFLGYWQCPVSWRGHCLQEFYIYRVIELHFSVLYRCCVFYKLEGIPSTRKKITTHFIAVIWNQTHNFSEVCIYFIIYRFYTLFWMYIAKINTVPQSHLNLAGREGIHRLSQVHKPQMYVVKLSKIKEKENL